MLIAELPLARAHACVRRGRAGARPRGAGRVRSGGARGAGAPHRARCRRARSSPMPGRTPSSICSSRCSRGGRRAPAVAVRDMTPARRGRVVVVGGPAGAGRTEVACTSPRRWPTCSSMRTMSRPQSRRGSVCPSSRTCARPSTRSNTVAANSAVRSSPCPDTQCAAVVGLPNASGWSQVRVGEVMRVVEGFVADPTVVVADCGASLEEVGGPPRGRNAVARALVLDADAIVAVCPATPVGIARFLTWVVEARRLAPFVPMVVAVNRAPSSRFRRGEIYEELTRSLPPAPIEFLADDRRVTDAAWLGRTRAHGSRSRAPSRASPNSSRRCRAQVRMPVRSRFPATTRAGVVTTRTDAYEVIRRDALAGIERRRLQPERELAEVRGRSRARGRRVPTARSAGRRVPARRSGDDGQPGAPLGHRLRSVHRSARTTRRRGDLRRGCHV